MPRVNPSMASQVPNPMFRLGALVHGRPEVVHLEFDESDFATPRHIIEAGARSLRDERQGYGPGAGIPILRASTASRRQRST